MVCPADVKEQASELVKLAGQSTAHHARRPREATSYAGTQLEHLGMLLQDLVRHIEVPIVAQEDDVLGDPLRGPVPKLRWRFAIECVPVDQLPARQPFEYHSALLEVPIEIEQFKATRPKQSVHIREERLPFVYWEKLSFHLNKGCVRQRSTGGP
jgi:hypothetical protein